MSLAEMLEFVGHLDKDKAPLSQIIPLLERPQDSRSAVCPFLSRSKEEGFRCAIYQLRPEACKRYQCKALELLAASNHQAAVAMVQQENWNVCKKWAPQEFNSRFPSQYIKSPSA
jgi:Fe-S-cluster containining protein